MDAGDVVDQANGHAKVSVVVFSVQGRYGCILDGEGIKSDSRGMLVEGQTGTFVSTELRGLGCWLWQTQYPGGRWRDSGLLARMTRSSA